jgi:hypothetical protein
VTRVAPNADPPGTASTGVTVVSTIKATVVDSTIPPLSENHARLFRTGVGHVVGSVGLFISDLSIFRRWRGASLRSLADVDLYYTPLGGGITKKATLASLANPNVAAFGDLVGSVYVATQQIGSLQIRAAGFLASGSVGGGFVGYATSGTLRFYNRTGDVVDRTINLNPPQTGTYADVTTTLFGITTAHVGYMVFTPSNGGTFAVSRRNYSTPAGSNATFGTAVPIVNLNAALKPNQVRRIGGIEDASPDTIGAPPVRPRSAPTPA